MSPRLVLIGVVGTALLSLAGCSGDSGGGSLRSLADSSTTSGPRPTTAEPTFVTDAPTTTLSPADAKAAMIDAFTQTRNDFVPAIQASTDVASADKIEYDPVSDSIDVEVTSRWASPDNQVDGAWNITKLVAALWETEGSGLRRYPPYAPGFRLVNSGTVYHCTSDVMIAIAEIRASREDWQAQCQG